MLKKLSNHKLLLWLTIIFLALIIISFIGRDHEPEQYSPYLSDSPSPTGTKALFTYLAEKDIKTGRWYHEPSLLAQEKNTLLLMVEPYFMFSENDSFHYEEFMNGGNKILLFSESPKDMFGTKTTFATQVDDRGSFQYQDRSYQLEINNAEYIQVREGEEKLLSDSIGTYAYKRKYGDGELIVVKASKLLTNGSILNEDHAEFITTLLADLYEEGYEIKFDEYIHEAKVVSSYLRAYPFWFLVFLLQGLIVTLLWLFYKGKRFGPIYRPREDYVRFSDESIVALASWHMKSKRYQDSLRIQADYMKQLLYDKWHIPYRLSWRESNSLLKAKWGRPEKDIEQFVSQLEEVLAKESLNKNEYIKWSKRLDDLRKEVEAS